MFVAELRKFHFLLCKVAMLMLTAKCLILCKFTLLELLQPACKAFSVLMHCAIMLAVIEVGCSGALIWIGTVIHLFTWEVISHCDKKLLINFALCVSTCIVAVFKHSPCQIHFLNENACIFCICFTNSGTRVFNSIP